MATTDVTILGAGPYGLAAGAHLGKIKGLELRIFGEPMLGIADRAEALG